MRARVLLYLLVLAAAAIVVTGLVAYTVQLAQLDRTIDRELTLRTEAFLDLASSPDPSTGDPWATPGSLLRAGIRAVTASDTESAVGHIDGTARFVPGGPGGLDLADDPQFLEAATASADTVVAVQSMTTDVRQYRFVSVPLLNVDSEVVGTFTVATDRGELVHALRELFGIYAMAGVAVLALIGLIAWVSVGRLLAPIRVLDETAREISESDLSRRIPVAGHDDLAGLGRTVNAMLDRLEAAFDAQRRLLDDAGHELRTPLAVMRANLELLEPRDSEQVEQTQELLLDEVAMMSRLVDDLVVLAKAERPEFLVTGAVDIAQLTDTTLARAQALGDRVWVLASRAEVTVAGDQQRLGQAWMQLVANAVKFSEPGTAVTLAAEEAAGEVRLSVADQGIGIPADEVPLVLARFHRVDASVEGAGLGLPIVEVIARGHGGRVEVESTEGVGTCVSMLIPLHRGET